MFCLPEMKQLTAALDCQPFTRLAYILVVSSNTTGVQFKINHGGLQNHDRNVNDDNLINRDP